MVVNPNKLGFEALHSNTEDALITAQTMYVVLEASFNEAMQLSKQNDNINHYCELIRVDSTNRGILIAALGAKTSREAFARQKQCNEEYHNFVSEHNDKYNKLLRHCNKYVNDSEYGKSFQTIIDNAKSKYIQIER